MDRFYVSTAFNNRIMECFVGFSDHHLVVLDMNVTPTPITKSYWHFNTQLLKDVLFSEQFVRFWEKWQVEKNSFPNLKQWWEVWKIQVKVFCQQYTGFSTARVRGEILTLKEDITAMEQRMFLKNDPGMDRALQEKKQELAEFLN